MNKLLCPVKRILSGYVSFNAKYLPSLDLIKSKHAYFYCFSTENEVEMIWANEVEMVWANEVDMVWSCKT